MKPSTRQFLLSVGFVALFMVVFFVRAVLPLIRSTGGDLAGNTTAILAEAAFFGGILVLGVGFAWFRLVRERKERAKRRPPTSFS